MVRNCIVCRKSWNKTTIRSFHRFPRDIFKRQQWLKNLNLNEEDLKTVKDAVVCSDHFLPEDLFTNCSDTYYLKFNALPIETLVEASSIENNSVETYTNSTDIYLKKNNSLKDNIPSSTTLARTSSKIVSTEVSSKKKKFNSPQYMGDCHISDMSSPTKVKKNWQIAKKRSEKQERIIDLLRCQNLRLRKKMKSLNSLLAHLNKNI